MFSKRSRKKQSKFTPIIGTAIMLVCIAVVLSTGAEAITKENIQRHLQIFGESVSKEATDNGKEGKFTYGDVEIKGWGYRKYGVIQNVSVVIAEKALLDTSKWSFSTSSILVKPDSFNVRRLFFSFPEPINVIENSELKTTITFSSPPQYAYFDGNKSGVHTIEHTVRMPDQIVLMPFKSVDASPKKTSNVIITYDRDPLFNVTVLPDSKERDSRQEVHNLKIISDEGAPQLVIGSLSSHYKEKQRDDKQLEGSYELKASDVLLKGEGDNVMTPYSIDVDLVFNAMPPVPVSAGSSSPAGGSADITLNQVALLTSEFELKLDGKVSAASDDPLLFGAVNLDIKNAGNFLASDLVPTQLKTTVTGALQMASGQPIDATTHLTIPLKREKNGVFLIGGVTFEQLAASIFSDMLKNAVPISPAMPSMTTPPSSESAAPVPPISAGTRQPPASEGDAR